VNRLYTIESPVSTTRSLLVRADRSVAYKCVSEGRTVTGWKEVSRSMAAHLICDYRHCLGDRVTVEVVR